MVLPRGIKMKTHEFAATVGLILAAALVLAGCLGDEEEEEEKMDLVIEIIYEGNWTAKIDADGDLQEVSGNGTDTVDVTAMKVSVNVTRTDNGTGSININIMEGTLPLAGTSSTDEYVALVYPDEEE
jgi:hypothetical protein